MQVHLAQNWSVLDIREFFSKNIGFHHIVVLCKRAFDKTQQQLISLESVLTSSQPNGSYFKFNDHWYFKESGTWKVNSDIGGRLSFDQNGWNNVAPRIIH